MDSIPLRFDPGHWRVELPNLKKIFFIEITKRISSWGIFNHPKHHPTKNYRLVYLCFTYHAQKCGKVLVISSTRRKTFRPKQTYNLSGGPILLVIK